MNKMTFKIAWENYEKKLPQPKRVRKIKQINFEEFKNKVLEEKKDLYINSCFFQTFYHPLSFITHPLPMLLITAPW